MSSLNLSSVKPPLRWALMKCGSTRGGPGQARLLHGFRPPPAAAWKLEAQTSLSLFINQGCHIVAWCVSSVGSLHNTIETRNTLYSLVAVSDLSKLWLVAWLELLSFVLLFLSIWLILFDPCCRPSTKRCGKLSIEQLPGRPTHPRSQLISALQLTIPMRSWLLMQGGYHLFVWPG